MYYTNVTVGKYGVKPAPYTPNELLEYAASLRGFTTEVLVGKHKMSADELYRIKNMKSPFFRASTVVKTMGAGRVTSPPFKTSASVLVIPGGTTVRAFQGKSFAGTQWMFDPGWVNYHTSSLRIPDQKSPQSYIVQPAGFSLKNLHHISANILSYCSESKVCSADSALVDVFVSLVEAAKRFLTPSEYSNLKQDFENGLNSILNACPPGYRRAPAQVTPFMEAAFQAAGWQESREYPGCWGKTQQPQQPQQPQCRSGYTLWSEAQGQKPPWKVYDPNVEKYTFYRLNPPYYCYRAIMKPVQQQVVVPQQPEPQVQQPQPTRPSGAPDCPSGYKPEWRGGRWSCVPESRPYVVRGYGIGSMLFS